MSMFNLDRFRYEKAARTSVEQDQNKDPKGPECQTENNAAMKQVQSKEPKSPECEKENNTDHAKPPSSPSQPSDEGVVLLDPSSDESDDIVFVSELAPPNPEYSFKKKSKKSKHLSKRRRKHRRKLTEEEIIDKVIEEVIAGMNSRTRDVAVGTRVKKFVRKERAKKRKLDGSSSSQDSGNVEPLKKKQPIVVDLEDWENQEALVKRLQEQFPDKENEDLWSALEKHNWEFDDALQALRKSFYPEHRNCTSQQDHTGQNDDIVVETIDSEEEILFVSEIKGSQESQPSELGTDTRPKASKKKPVKSKTRLSDSNHTSVVSLAKKAAVKRKERLNAGSR